MKTRLRRLVGYSMIAAAIIGLLFTSVIGFRVWRIRLNITEMIDSNIGLVKEMVLTTNGLLVIVDETLSHTSNELDTLLKSILSLTNILQDSGPLIESIQDLTGNSLPATIQATQTSLDTAQQSADIIDNLLRTISRIPFFPGDPYNPEVPLSESLNQISKSLDLINPALGNIQTNLVSTQENISQIDTNLTNISEDALQIQQNLTEAKNTIQRYQQYMKTAESRLSLAQQEAPGWVNRIAGGIIFMLVWLGFAQIGLLFQGINLVVLQ